MFVFLFSINETISLPTSQLLSMSFVNLESKQAKCFQYVFISLNEMSLKLYELLCRIKMSMKLTDSDGFVILHASTGQTEKIISMVS